MAQPPIVKAKVKDRPALKDLANFVVPRASHKWYYIGLQLFDPKDVEILNNMRANTSRSLDDNCIDVFNHWLNTKENPTWHKLLKVLKCRAVNLPNVAKDIEKLLDDHSTWSKGKRRIKQFIKGEQSLPPISEYHSKSVDSEVPFMMTGPTQQQQGNSIFYLSDDPYDSSDLEESDADEISRSYNQRSTSLPRSESQQCLAFNSHPPRQRSVSVNENQLAYSKKALSSSDINQLHNETEDFAKLKTTAKHQNSRSGLPTRDYASPEASHKAEYINLKAKIQSLEDSLNDSIARLQQQFNSNESSKNVKFQALEQQFNELQSGIVKKLQEDVIQMQKELKQYKSGNNTNQTEIFKIQTEAEKQKAAEAQKQAPADLEMQEKDKEIQRLKDLCDVEKLKTQEALTKVAELQEKNLSLEQSKKSLCKKQNIEKRLQDALEQCDKRVKEIEDSKRVQDKLLQEREITIKRLQNENTDLQKNLEQSNSEKENQKRQVENLVKKLQQNEKFVTPTKDQHTVTPAKSQLTVTPAKGRPTVTPAKDQPTVTLTKDQHTITPVKYQHTVTPAKDQHTVTPAKDQHTVTPAKSQHTVTPAKDQHTVTPAKSQHTVTPVKSQHTVTPATDHQTAIPAEDQHTERQTKDRLAETPTKKNHIEDPTESQPDTEHNTNACSMHKSSPSVPQPSNSKEHSTEYVHTTFGERRKSSRTKTPAQDDKKPTSSSNVDSQLQDFFAKRHKKNANPNALEEFEEAVRMANTTKQNEDGEGSELSRKLQKQKNKIT